MILLKSTNEILRIITSSIADIDYSVSYADITTTTFLPSTNEGKINTATTTTILVSPASSTQRQIKQITITNRHASSASEIIVEKDISGIEYYLTPTVSLLAGETLQYLDGAGWSYYSSDGSIKNDQVASGLSTNIQYSNVGVLAGDADFTWDGTNKTLGLTGADTGMFLKGIDSEPSASSINHEYVYAKAISGKMQLKIKGPSGLETPLQAALWSNALVWWAPGISGGVWTGATGSSGGTAAIVLPAATNLYTVMRRSTFASATTANAQVGIRTTNAFLRGNLDGMGGFMFTCRFGLNTWTAGNRLFVGLCAGTTAVVTVNPSTLTNTLGFCVDAGDTAISFLHNDATVTNPAKKEAIPGQPALASLQGYDAYIRCAPNDSTVYYRLDDVLTGATIIDSSVSSDLPVNTTLLDCQCIMGNGANIVTGNATIGIARMYIETDR
jgi:hypothetical protein